ncbi:FkbM family methyltransferase [Actinokineospora enzanensis]|uniref:FkbM family methyltransferase n=1 Tax=Actinokineospora enzanensis TaxID=155975 RepID=UPI00039BD4D7|nr:FkbM family methyltransferase [Actinokineospora enzanensis]
MGTIKLARRMFSHTRVHSWPVTAYLYRRVFRVVADGSDETADFHGVRLTFPTVDVGIAPGLLNGYYEQQELSIYEDLAKVSKTIVDIGGNIGIYACVGARHLPADGRVVSFEPVPDNLTRLRQNLEQNDLQDKVTVAATAVGAEAGEITLHLAEGLTGAHSVSAETVGTARGSVVVPMVRVDDYLTEQGVGPIDVVKIDVEGFDVAALRGMSKTLQADSPTLLVEYAPALMRNCGFEPSEMRDIVFDTYQHVFLIDEPRNSVRFTTQDELAKLDDKKVLLNLIGVNRPEHLSIIKRHAVGS